MITIRAAQSTAKVVAVPSPIGGINAYDNLAAMPPTDAIRMVNLIPTPYGCTVRKGFQTYAYGMNGPVETIASNTSVLGTDKLFAATQNTIYDITGSGGALPVITGLRSGYWQQVNFANSAGTHLVMFNGVDNPVWYTEKFGLQRLASGNGVENATWSGVDPTTIVQATIHQRRIWGVERNSTLGWYLPPDSIYGVANFFDFGPFFKSGGYLVALGTWSADLGGGSDDSLVAFSSEGDAVVFGGIDVADASNWKLKGVYRIGGPPQGRRFLTNVAGDLLVVTKVGVVSMSSVLVSTSVNVTSETAYSKKIQYMLNEMLGVLGGLPGWEIYFAPAENLIYINVPSVYSGGNGQLVCNNINSSWCTFSGLDAICWHEFSNVQYFGGRDGTVQRITDSYLDAVQYDGSGGQPIKVVCQQAYNTLQLPAIQKQIGLYRPTFMSTRAVGTYTALVYDFKTVIDSYITSMPGSARGSLWDTAIWDVDVWGGGILTQRDWHSGAGLGATVSLLMAMSVVAETTWVSTDYTYKYGGPL